MDSPSKLPNPSCAQELYWKFCKYIGFSSPDEQADADEKIAMTSTTPLPRSKIPGKVNNIQIGDICKVKDLCNGGIIDAVTCDFCKTLPEDFHNVTLIELCIPCIDELIELSMDSPSKLPNQLCEFCKDNWETDPFALKLSSPDEQAGADEKLAKIVEEMGFRKVERQDNED